MYAEQSLVKDKKKNGINKNLVLPKDAENAMNSLCKKGRGHKLNYTQNQKETTVISLET